MPEPDVHAKWSAAVSAAWNEAAAAANDVTPLPIAVSKPMGIDDRGFEADEIIEGGARGFGWVEFSADSREADEFIEWLAGETETEHPPPVDAAAMPGDEEAEERSIRVHAFYDSYERSRAAAETLAARLDRLLPGLTVRAETRYD